MVRQQWRWSSVESPGTLHFEGFSQSSIGAWVQAKHKGGKDIFNNFCVTQNFAFPNFCKWISNSHQTCLKACFMPMKKMLNFFTIITLMICFFREHFFWHCGMFLCFASSFVNQCKNSFIIGFSNHSSGSHCLDLVKALKWSSRILSTQVYNSTFHDEIIIGQILACLHSHKNSSMLWWLHCMNKAWQASVSQSLKW